jgi:hypothetical protein
MCYTFDHNAKKATLPVAFVIEIAAKRCGYQHKFLAGMQKRMDVLFVEALHIIGDPIFDYSIEMVPGRSLPSDRIPRQVAYISMPNQSTAPARW